MSFLLLATGLSLATLSAQAQQAPDRLRTEAAEATRQLANRIALDDARTMRVRRITYDRLVQESAINTMYADDPAMRQNKLRVAEQEYSAQLKELLSAEQYQRYETLLAAGTLSGTPGTAATKAAGQ